jgi:hypothetical protein
MRSTVPFFTFVIIAACSSSSGSTDAVTPAGDDGGTSTNEGGGGDDGGGGGGGTDVPPPSACPASSHKTLVIVGDSISDVGSGGGADEPPFYRTLLVKNDDAKYPAWKGFDLATCWGLDESTHVVKASKGGAKATIPANNTPSNMGVLVNQVKSLPATLEGPVLVVGTIGGNDVQAGLVAVLTGNAQQAQKNIESFAAGFGAAMADLTKADRFGAGVKVDVVMTNIYDPSGGSGHFYYEPEKKTCPGALGLWPDNQSTDAELTKWNVAMTTEAAKYSAVKMVEMRSPFVKHSVSTPPGTNWFHDDCIHPNALGHDAIRGIVWAGLVQL